jgi:biopolymer transport protein ExbD
MPKNKPRELPAISTASLPDIIFILLFFFMVVTVMRTNTIMLKIKNPSASEVKKIEDKSLICYLYVGTPLEQYAPTYGTAPRIQLGDQIAEATDIPQFLNKFRGTKAETDLPKIIASLRVDGEVTMGKVDDLRLELRKNSQYKVNYSAKPRARY